MYRNVPLNNMFLENSTVSSFKEFLQTAIEIPPLPEVEAKIETTDSLHTSLQMQFHA
jgi:hypothetical protein